ncbi:hypothetical protein Pcinc_039836 [Petrolisthes cinctipes]|uniref:ETS domain-containing protein n=1 Tax=Petrolisthes cinctipes TaxID=88211 RepID=A0AAE1EJ47_PETCI|nr:hypothetical protein Pcinc_039836 [Petrolisthes cinctipes]
MKSDSGQLRFYDVNTGAESEELQDSAPLDQSTHELPFLLGRCIRCQHPASSSSACSSLSVTQQLSSSVPCLITLNPCLDAPLTTNPSPSHSLPPNPCPNATVAIPSAVNKVLSWLGGDSPTKDPKPGPAASPKIKRKRGRPAKSGARRERGKKIPLIHDFIRGLLDDPTEEEVVSWEDKKEGTFRIRDSNEIAKLWGKLKNKQSMNYENFSRALRYHHNSKRPALIAVPGRLVFKFNTISKSRTNG